MQGAASPVLTRKDLAAPAIAVAALCVTLIGKVGDSVAPGSALTKDMSTNTPLVIALALIVVLACISTVCTSIALHLLFWKRSSADDVQFASESVFLAGTLLLAAALAWILVPILLP